MEISQGRVGRKASRACQNSDVERSVSQLGFRAAPRLQLSGGALEALKWLALVLMAGDHINKYLYDWGLPYLFEAGRVAMPLFVFVLAYNLGRPGTLERGVYARTVKRLALFGVISTPIFIALGHLSNGWYPLNILFALLVLTAVVWLIDLASIKGHAAGFAAAVLFCLGGALVEYWWPAVGLGVSIWWYYRRGSWLGLLAALGCLASLAVINSNSWALLALPVVFAASFLRINTPRLRWFFYVFYPGHLLFLLALLHL